ncbi:LacI family DNA-binding transcriptional regulator [Proteus mirabilis]|nr:LacI family DNA-binding transcriptional regulator [Proteus mirabilis]WFC30601.1 LacI family DNA-binding transcriptional regulator [Proteus mirabilis]
MTVSRAINNPELLKPDTLKQVQRAIEELNYVPDFSARKIRGQGTKVSSIGVLRRTELCARFFSAKNSRSRN